MADKPQNPYPLFLRYVLKKVLSTRIYHRYFGRHEKGSLRIWQEIASKMSKQDAILDIGAFHGEYALAARLVNNNASVFAFEPNPISFSTLKEKCRGQDIQLEEYAVSQKSDVVNFSMTSAMSHIEHSDTPTKGSSIQVRSIRLDDWVSEKHDLIVALLKIDVEGFESDVLLGAQNTIIKYRPTILCEILSDKAGQRVMEILHHEYIYYHIDENQHLLSQRPLITRERWRDKNWLFLHPSKADLVKELI